MPSLILASTSPYRRLLLERLGLEFTQISPEVDETPESEETPTNLALRLARQKAVAVSERYPEAIVIGSDQVASMAGEILNKPLSKEVAIEQLASLSGNEAIFYAAVCVVNGPARNSQVEIETTTVFFRNLSREEIIRYVTKEPAFDCVGAFKSEGLGISLTEKIENDDPTALIGLPLIRLSHMLNQAGIVVP